MSTEQIYFLISKYPGKTLREYSFLYRTEFGSKIPKDLAKTSVRELLSLCRIISIPAFNPKKSTYWVCE